MAENGAQASKILTFLRRTISLSGAYWVPGMQVSRGVLFGYYFPFFQYSSLATDGPREKWP